MEKLRYGIIGVGKQGSMYSRILTTGLVKNAILTAVCDIEEERIKWATEKFLTTHPNQNQLFIWKTNSYGKYFN